MEYPLSIIRKRLEKKLSPGVIYVDGEIFSTHSVGKPVTHSKEFYIWVAIIFTLIASLVVIIMAFYVIPYKGVRQQQEIVKMKEVATNTLFEGRSFTSQLQNMGFVDYTSTEYADDTVMVSIPVDGDLSELFTLVSKTKGVLSMQYSTGTLYVVLLRGAL